MPKVTEYLCHPQPFYVYSRYGMHMVVPKEADTPELQAAYDRALAASFSAARADKLWNGPWVRTWFDHRGELHCDPVDVRKPVNPRARALIGAVVSSILH
jgi:hypothetical protein